MRPRNTIIALVLLALIGGYALVVGYFSKPSETQKLLGIKLDDIKTIELKYPDREIELARDKPTANWRIVKPVGSEADQFQSNNLARAIADCAVDRVVDEKPDDVAPFGLDKPRVKVTVTTFGGKTMPTIEVGKQTPIGFDTYIRESTKPGVMVTGAAFGAGMDKKLGDLRNRDLMSFNMDDVTKLTLTRDNGGMIEIDRAGDKWKIVKPAAYATDDTQVRQALSTLINAKVADFISDAPPSVTQYGLEKPHLTATVTMKDGSQQSLLFGFKQSEQGKDGIYVRRGERASVYTVPGYVLSNTDRPLMAFRDKTIFSFDPASVATIVVKRQGGDFTIKRADGGKWKVISGGKTQDGDVAGIERFLTQLRTLKGSSLIADPMPSEQPFGLDHPALDITLEGKDGKQIGQVRLAKIVMQPTAAPVPGESEASRTQYYATASSTRAVYALSDFSFAQLNKPADLYLARSGSAPASAPAKPMVGD